MAAVVPAGVIGAPVPFQPVEQAGKAFHPVLFHIQGESERKVTLEQLRGFLRWIAEVHLLALGDIQIFAETVQFVEQTPSGPGRGLQ